MSRGFLFGSLLLVIFGCAFAANPEDQVSPAGIKWFNPDGTVNWEAEKQQKQIPTDTIVIHHTATTPGMTWQQLSEIQYQTLYVPRYRIDDPEPYVKG